MQRRFSRISLALILLLSGEVLALGLGEIRLDSALNEPLRAEIELLSASPEELDGLRVALASTETFARYGIERPFYLQDLVFEIVRSGTADGNYVRITSPSPITEPFLTFLVEATWSRGRLLREYTVLLDPPTFAPPTSQSQPAVTAPQRSTPTDSGRIEREAPPPRQTQSQPPPRPAPSRPAPARTQPQPEPQPEPVRNNIPPERYASGDYLVRRGDTLWGIASAVRPDTRMSMNQTMLAIFEANPGAFAGNINILSAGANLRIPNADEIFEIDRGYAFQEAQRQHAEWDSGYTPVPRVSTTPTTTTEPADTETTLVLVPPDEDPVGIDTGADTGDGEQPAMSEQALLDRIAELEAMEMPIQQSLIEVRNNELAALRQQLAEIQGELYEPPVDDEFVYDETMDDATATDDTGVDDILADDTMDEAAADDTAADDASTDTSAATGGTLRAEPDEPSIIDQAIELLTRWWMIIAGVLVIVGALLFWFMRRGRDDDDDEAWESSMDPGDALSATESLRAPQHDESIVVVEQQPAFEPIEEDTLEAPMPAPEPIEPLADPTVMQEQPAIEEQAATDQTGQFGSLEDTFSSETAVNLDQSDPIAEADFHMAYGLYDQAADLVNGALQIEPERQDLLTKLCEIYFVWGNRDAFVDAAERLKGVVGDASDADWDKIVIMGQQIAADHALFAGAGVAGATKEVDLTFDMDDGDGVLDMEFGADEGGDDIIDIGAETEMLPEADDGLDFALEDTGTTEAVDTDADTSAHTADFNITAEMPTVEAEANEATVEMPSRDDDTVETPTIEEQFAGFESTSELPSISEDELGDAIESSGQASDETAEINLDELGLDVDGLAETEVASFDDLDATGTNEALNLDDIVEVTGKNPQIDPDMTGVQQALDPELDEALQPNTGMRLAPDETGQNPMLDSVDDSQSTPALDESLLDATGHTQVLSETMAVETITEDETLIDDDDTAMSPVLDEDDTLDALADDEETLLATMDDDDEGDFDFAKTEALPPEVFTGNASLDETGEMPAVASTDVDLDLDDLTAALQVSELGDTVEQMRDDATVEQPRDDATVEQPRDDATVEQPRLDVGGDDETVETLSLSPDDMSEDLHEARTMTEVGTKLDLARAYVDMGDPAGARSILEEVLDEGDEGQRQQAQQLLDSLPT